MGRRCDLPPARAEVHRHSKGASAGHGRSCGDYVGGETQFQRRLSGASVAAKRDFSP